MTHRDLVTRVVIVVKDGMVVDVYRPKEVTVEILDLDTEGADADDLCGCPMADAPHWHSGYGGNWLE